MESTENIARLLKSIWVNNGIVSSAAFNLRPHIHETYISVLRESVESFADDALLDIRKSLARLASQKIRYLEDKNSPSS
ncbi:MAG: hypothetical protein IJS95_03610 [Prevotella sp.]|nr:hypothetical protein [Prevotella sp.]